MLKPLTMSLSLAVALGLTSVSMAGIGNCSSCGIASPQGPIPSAQGAVVASPQSCSTGIGGLCGGGGGWKMPKMSWCHKPKCYTYEWVLKKRRVRGCGGGCETPSCTTCGTSVYPSAQGYASPQAYSSGQSYIPTAYGSGQAYHGGTYGSTQYGGGTYGSTQYNAPQATGVPAPSTTATPAPSGDEAPPAPEVAPSNTPAPAPPAPPTPAPPAPAPPTGPTSSLLFSTPSGN